MNKRGLDNLRRKAEEDLSNNDRKIKGMGKVDLATMAHELAVHQAELEIQNEECANQELWWKKPRNAIRNYLILRRWAILRWMNTTGLLKLISPDISFLK